MPFQSNPTESEICSRTDLTQRSKQTEGLNLFGFEFKRIRLVWADFRRQAKTLGPTGCKRESQKRKLSIAWCAKGFLIRKNPNSNFGTALKRSHFLI